MQPQKMTFVYFPSRDQKDRVEPFKVELFGAALLIELLRSLRWRKRTIRVRLNVLVHLLNALRVQNRCSIEGGVFYIPSILYLQERSGENKYRGGSSLES